jgi:hypothetical protein
VSAARGAVATVAPMTHHRMPRPLAVAGIAAAVALGLPTAAGAEGPSDVTCGSVVTRDVRLRADLSCPGPGLLIGAPGVRIDLGGHTLSGPGDGVGIDGNGGFDGVTIRNGTIRGFLHGIDLLETDHGRIEGVLVTGNGRGINISRSIGMRVDRVIVDDNRFDGISVTFSEDTEVRRSVASRNGVSGVNELASLGSVYDRDVLVDNELHGITISQSDGVAIRATEATGNGGTGIELGFWARTTTVAGSRTSANGGDGIRIDEPGNHIGRHTASFNAGTGIAAVAGTIDDGRNRAFGNGGAGCTNVTCR